MSKNLKRREDNEEIPEHPVDDSASNFFGDEDEIAVAEELLLKALNEVNKNARRRQSCDV